MAKFDHFKEDNELLQLIENYEKMKKGLASFFFDEDQFHQIIDYYEHQEAYREALEATEFACDFYPNTAEFFLRKADFLIDLQRYSLAEEANNRAFMLDDKHPDVYLIYAELCLIKEKDQKAWDWIWVGYDLLEDEESKLEFLFEASEIFDEYDLHEEVFLIIKEIVSKHNDNEEALHKICFWADATNNNEESIKLHQKILDNNPFNTIAWFNLGVAYQSLKFHEKAVEAYQIAIDLDEKFDYAYRNMADALIRLRKYDKAIQMLEKVLELAPNEEIIFEALGFCYNKLKQFSAARQQFKKAAYLNPEDSRIMFAIGETYLAENYFDEGLNYLKRAIKIMPHADYYYKIGEVYFNNENYDEAYNSYRNAIRMKPKNVKYWMALVKLNVARNDKESLLEIAAACENLLKSKMAVEYIWAIAYLKNKNLGAALLSLETALRKQPKFWKKISFLVNDDEVNLEWKNLVSQYSK